MKILVLQFVQSVRSENMEDCRLTYYLFALNHPNYARCTPVHIHNMLLLPTTYLDVNEHSNRDDSLQIRLESCFQTKD